MSQLSFSMQHVRPFGLGGFRVLLCLSDMLSNYERCLPYFIRTNTLWWEMIKTSETCSLFLSPIIVHSPHFCTSSKRGFSLLTLISGRVAENYIKWKKPVHSSSRWFSSQPRVVTFLRSYDLHQCFPPRTPCLLPTMIASFSVLMSSPPPTTPPHNRATQKRRQNGRNHQGVRRQLVHDRGGCG